MKHKNLIGPQIRKLRKQRGWTIEMLASECARQGVFVSEKTLERIESRRESIGTVGLVAFTLIFRVQADELFPPDTSPEMLETLRAVKHGKLPRFHSELEKSLIEQCSR